MIKRYGYMTPLWFWDVLHPQCNEACAYVGYGQCCRGPLIGPR